MKQNQLDDMRLFANVTGFRYGWRFTAMGALMVLAFLFIAAIGEAIGNAIAGLF